METAGLSLVCNILHSMKVSKSVIETCYDIYRGTAAGKDLVAGTKDLQTTIKVLEDGLDFASDKGLSKDDESLLRQCRAIQEQARLLQMEASNLFKGTKYVARGKDEISDLSKTLERQEIHLNTQLNVSISKHLDTSGIAPDASKKQVDEMSHAFRQLLHQQETLEAQSKAQQLLRARAEAKAQLLMSLRFPTMFYRRDMISKAHEATFRWVFDSSVDHSWDPFPSWLADAEDQRPYWISGKPGAGKSTLVQYIERHPDLKAGLKTAFPASDVHVVSHYLWLAGATIKEKSVEGILRSLLFQVIKHHDDCGEFAGVVGGPEDWTPRLLQDALISSVEASGKAWLIILDGLDEVVDDMRAIVELIDQLSAMQQTKVLASGRPLQPLERYFESSKKLRVQDLTKDDIRAYLEERLGKVLPADNYITRKDYRRLVDAGVSQSQGVFLWVKVATNAILEAIDYREPIKDIHKLLQELPSDLDAMFTIMLSRLGPRNEAQALVYFQLMLSADQTTGDLNLIQLAAMDLICPYLRGPSPTLLTSTQVIEHANAVRSFATGRCGNFVEVIVGRHSFTEELTFVHRTAHDFLRGYFTSSNCKFSSLDARFLLAEAQVHLIRIADDDYRILGAVAGYRQVDALVFMGSITEDPQRRLETIWNDITQSSHHLMRQWNQRLGLDFRPDLWTQSMRHMGFIVHHFDDGWQILQDPERVRKLLANRYFYRTCNLPRDMALDSTGAACSILLDHVVQEAVTMASAEELTYLAFCCLGWEPLDNELQQTSTNRRHFPGLLVDSMSKLMQAGAIIDHPRGHVIYTREDMYGQRRHHYDSYWDHDSLWKTFVVNTTIFSSRDGRHELDLAEGGTQMVDMLNLFKLFVAHGAAISGTNIIVDMQPQTGPFRTGHLRFVCNLTAAFCR